MNRIIDKNRVTALLVLLLTVICIYLGFLYKLQIVEGED